MKPRTKISCGLSAWMCSAVCAAAASTESLVWSRPLAAQRPALEAAANAGDAEAAWALYQGLERCRHAAVRAAMPQTESRNAVQGARLRQCLELAWCSGIRAMHWRQGTDWLARAAEAGYAEARLQYAQGAFLHTSELPSLRHAPRYMAVALDWMEAAARAGSSAAVLALARAYASDDEGYEGPLGQLVAQDRSRAAMYLHVQQRRTQSVTAVEAGSIAALAASMQWAVDPRTDQAGAAAATRWLQQSGTVARATPAPLSPLPKVEDFGPLAAGCLAGRAEAD